MSIRSTPRLARVALALIALVALSFTAPAAFARSSFGISVSVPGLGISYSEHGRHSSWNGYVSGGYSSYGGYGYGYAPQYYPSYYQPYYQPYYRPVYRNYYGGGYYGRPNYRPATVVYHDRGSYRGRSHRGGHDRGRYDDSDRYRGPRSGYSDRGGYYDRGH